MKIKENTTLQLLSLICFLMVALNSKSQDDPTIWDDPYNNWDGVTHWTRYIIMSPKYMGPNALPIPEVKNGRIGENWELQNNLEYHYFDRDKTFNLFSKINIPLAKGIVSLELYGVPIEHYNMDTSLRYERKTHLLVGKGFATGNFNFATNIQLVKDHRKFPDMALRLNCWVASGNKLTAARYTDTPGYFFDLSVGKKIPVRGKTISGIRVYGMLGFYAWQRLSSKHFQNDAFLFGGGFDVMLYSLTISNSIAGYKGYIKNGDNPRTYRINVTWQKEKIGLRAGYRMGFLDLDYDTVVISFIYRFFESKKEKV